MLTDLGLDRYGWERLLRRCRLPATTKQVGFVLAHYADRDGTNIWPSTARLARVTGLSERTVRKGLGELRNVGLVVRVRRGGYRGGEHATTDVHRLDVPGDLEARVAMLCVHEFVPGLCDEGCQPAPAAGSRVPGQTTEAAPAAGSVVRLHRVADQPNRQLATGEPAAGATEPAADDRRTGSSCRLPDQDQTNYQTNHPERPVPSATTDRARAAR